MPSSLAAARGRQGNDKSKSSQCAYTEPDSSTHLPAAQIISLNIFETGEHRFSCGEEGRGVDTTCTALSPILMHETQSFCTAVDTLDAARSTENKADLTHEFNQTASAT
eukprot:scaffold140309_cov26-Prasinocladus_malaysianus.AAC.1